MQVYDSNEPRAGRHQLEMTAQEVARLCFACALRLPENSLDTIGFYREFVYEGCSSNMLEQTSAILRNRVPIDSPVRG